MVDIKHDGPSNSAGITIMSCLIHIPFVNQGSAIYCSRALRKVCQVFHQWKLHKTFYEPPQKKNTTNDKKKKKIQHNVKGMAKFFISILLIKNVHNVSQTNLIRVDVTSFCTFKNRPNIKISVATKCVGFSRI